MANLTVTLTESVTLNGAARGSTNQLTITGIEQVMERIITIPGSAATTVLLTKQTVADSDSAIDIQDTKYIRVTNLDGSKNISLGVVGAATCHNIKIAAGESWIIGTPDDAYLAEADVNPSHTSHADITALEVQNLGSGVVQVEIVIASL